jgi:hypothetical protein
MRSWVGSGSASLRIHSATEGAAILFLSYSGGKPEVELLTAYDTVQNEVLWKNDVSGQWPWQVNPLQSPAYVVTTNTMLEIPQQGSTPAYRLDLRDLDWPVKPSDLPQFGKDREAFWRSLSFQVVLTDANEVVIARRCSRGSGGFFSEYFKDWVSVNLCNQLVQQSGRGQILGQTKDSALVTCDNQVYVISNTRKLDMTSHLTKLLPDFTIDPDWRRSWGTHHFTSAPNRSIFAVRGGETNHLVLFDSCRQDFTLITPPDHDSNREWMLHGDYILRHSGCETDTEHWLEVYNAAGVRITRTSLPLRQGHTHLSCLNTQTNATALFTLFTHKPAEAKGAQAASLLAVHVPSLRVTRKVSLLHCEIAPTQIFHVPDSDIAYLSYGGFYREKMETDTLDTTLVVRKINVISGEVLWQHKEKVTARKR